MVKAIRLDLYDWKLYIRSFIFAAFLIMAFAGDGLLERFLYYKILFLKVYHIIWSLLMAEMIIVFIPKWNPFLGCGKIYVENYMPVVHRESKLDLEKDKFNRRALTVALVWIAFVGGIGLLKIFGIIGNMFLYLTCALFYLFDQICINIWCPFRKLIMKNKCCNTCRIFNWGHFMMFSPLIFVMSIWTISLFVVSIIILIQWEIIHYKYPERFSQISNASLKCANCTAKCKWLQREKLRV